MSNWIGVVEHTLYSDKRIGETLINLDNVTRIAVTEDLIQFNDGSFIKVNRESMKHLLDSIETI